MVQIPRVGGLHSLRLESIVEKCSEGKRRRPRGGSYPDFDSKELDGAGDVANTELRAPTDFFSLRRLIRGLKVESLIPYLYTTAV